MHNLLLFLAGVLTGASAAAQIAWAVVKHIETLLLTERQLRMHLEAFLGDVLHRIRELKLGAGWKDAGHRQE